MSSLEITIFVQASLMFVCFFTAQTATAFKFEKYETLVADCEFNTIKCQHRSGNMAFPLQQQEMRATTDITPPQL